MKLNEYLFVDGARIDSYFEQISEPVKYDKVPIWKLAFGLGGPKVESTQNRTGRQYTRHEKISEIVRFVKQNGSPEFVLSSFIAQKAFLPPKIAKLKFFAGLSIWICRNNYSSGFAYLIEDFRKEDDEGKEWSGGTALQMLFSEFGGRMEEEMQKTVKSNKGLKEWHIELDKPLPPPSDYQGRIDLIDSLCKKLRISNEEIVIDNLHNVDDYCSGKASSGKYKFQIQLIGESYVFKKSAWNQMIVNRDFSREAAYLFATNPIELLSLWGAKIAEERKIDVLYRIRHTLIENSVSEGQDALIGYPIVIASTPSSLV